MLQLLGQKICDWTQPLGTPVESLIGMNDLQLASLLLSSHLKKNKLDPDEGCAWISEEVRNTLNPGQQQQQQKQGRTYCSYNAMPAINAPNPFELPQPPTEWNGMEQGEQDQEQEQYNMQLEQGLF
ncbi:GH17665 [Drosophila grimshawi]|uniref:GH17665 n=1 Tax=Drosophila grimshawi TaxID=7222 RepID=B4JWZ6_DROGR|nr:GH17665 [Drosophila grimshawi]